MHRPNIGPKSRPVVRLGRLKKKATPVKVDVSLLFIPKEVRGFLAAGRCGLAGCCTMEHGMGCTAACPWHGHE